MRKNRPFNIGQEGIGGKRNQRKLPMRRGMTINIMNELQGVVYILTNKNNTTLYTGVTRDLQRRLAEHKLHINQGFTAKYNIEKLVYYEWYDRLDDAIHREKQLKKWHRDWKEKLINDFNPDWRDLAEDIGTDAEYIQAVKDAYECGQYVAGDSGSSPE